MTQLSASICNLTGLLLFAVVLPSAAQEAAKKQDPVGITFDVGVDAGTPVSNKYRVTNHYPFTGELDKVVVRLTQ